MRSQSHLHEDNCGAGHGAEGAADKEPGDVSAIGVQVLEQVLLVLICCAVLPPAQRCLIVMCA